MYDNIMKLKLCKTALYYSVNGLAAKEGILGQKLLSEKCLFY